MAKQRQQLKPTEPVTVAAEIILSRNLKKLQRRLESAANFSDDHIRHVHRLRISTRRSIAALDLFREFLSDEERKQIARNLNEVRRIAAQARDLDVLIKKKSAETPNSNQKLIRHLQEKRKKAQQPVIDIYKQLRSGHRFRRECKQLLHSIKFSNATKEPDYSDWARHKLPKVVEKFFNQRPADASDLDQLHRFRIAAKKFRYSLDILEPAFPNHSFDSVAREIRQIQAVLGNLNDRAVAISRLERMKSKGIRIPKRVWRNEHKQLKRLRRKFAKWWTPKKARSVRRGFEKIIANGKCSGGSNNC